MGKGVVQSFKVQKFGVEEGARPRMVSLLRPFQRSRGMVSEEHLHYADMVRSVAQGRPGLGFSTSIPE